MALSATGEVLIGISVAGFGAVLTAIGGAVRLLLRKFEVFDSHVVRSGAVELEFVRRLGIIDGRLDRLDTQYQTVREALSVSTAEQERHFSWHERHDGA